MRFVTVATHADPRLDVFDASCRHFGIHVDRLGVGQQYKNHASKWIWLKEYLATLPPDEIVLQTDSYDAFFLSDQEEIERKFIQMDHPFVISAEQNLNLETSPLAKWSAHRRYAKGRAPYRYLNAGGWIARAGVALDVLNQFDSTQSYEQTMFQWFYLAQPGALLIDDRNEIFTTTGGRAGLEFQDYSIENERIHHRLTGTSPCIAHFPGGNLRGANRVLSRISYLPLYPVASRITGQERYSTLKNRITDLTFKDNYLFHQVLNAGLVMISVSIIAILLSKLL